MGLPPQLASSLPARLVTLLNEACARNNYSAVEQQFNTLAANDDLMKPYTGESGTKYYKPFVQTAAPKIIPCLRNALASNICPEIEINFSELEDTRTRLGISPFGSPQDVLYGFTSERYRNWGDTLPGMGFQSACMSGEGQMIISMAPRYLELGVPTFEIEEMKGAISKDFWETINIVFSEMNFLESLEHIISAQDLQTLQNDLTAPSDTSPAAISAVIESYLAAPSISAIDKMYLKVLSYAMKEIMAISSPAVRLRNFRRILEPSVAQEVTQEQIALKYMEEGNFLQKILGGQKVEHIQSNVKMVTNPLRFNKCEVDSIYRAIGIKKIVLVEAKSKDRISRAQLYSIYETYRLKLPKDWEISVIAVLREPPSEVDIMNGFSTIINLIEVGFDNDSMGKITESLLSVKPATHYRWKIRS